MLPEADPAQGRYLTVLRLRRSFVANGEATYRPFPVYSDAPGIPSSGSFIVFHLSRSSFKLLFNR